MRRFVLLVGLFLSTLSAEAKIGILYDLELGWVPDAGFGGWERSGVQYKIETESWNSFYVGLSLGLSLTPWLSAGGSMTVQMHYRPDPAFVPEFTNYGIWSEITLGIVRLFVAHDCSHPQVVYSYSYRVTSLWGEGSVTRVGLRVTNLGEGR
jgi:hypothetical protein